MSFANWTPTQKQAIKAWINGRGIRDTVELREVLTKRPITGYNDWTEEKPRDGFKVKVERELNGIANIYGITKQDTIAQALTKITNDKDELIFRMNYLHLRSMDVSGVDTTTVQHHDPIYGQSPAEVMGLGVVTGDDIEATQR